MKCPRCGKTLDGLRCNVCKFNIDTDELVIIGNKGRALSETIVGYIANQRKKADDRKRSGQEVAGQKAASDREAAQQADDAISAIGSVSFSNECDRTIKHARGVYDALNGSQKAYVTKVKTLQDAEAEFESLRIEYHRKEGARRFYAALSYLNVSALTADNLDYRALEAASDREAAQRADDAISAIGSVSFSNECDRKIKHARGVYDALNGSQKAYVTKVKTLQDAEAEFESLRIEYHRKEGARRFYAALSDLNVSALTADNLEYRVLENEANESLEQRIRRVNFTLTTNIIVAIFTVVVMLVTRFNANAFVWYPFFLGVVMVAPVYVCWFIDWHHFRWTIYDTLMLYFIILFDVASFLNILVFKKSIPAYNQAIFVALHVGIIGIPVLITVKCLKFLNENNRDIYVIRALRVLSCLVYLVLTVLLVISTVKCLNL